MAVVFKNNARTTLNGSITNVATSIVVTSGAAFPAVTTASGNYFYATIADGTNTEIVKVTNISTNTLTAVRGQDATSGTAFASGTTIEIRPTNQGLIDLRNDAVSFAYAIQQNLYLGAG